MPARFTGKSVIVTGSSNGIGRETAVLFAREGAKVTITGRSEKSLQEAKAELLAVGAKEADILVVHGDLMQEEIQQKLVDETVAKFGGIDILINNAGGMPDMCGQQGFEQTMETYDYIMNLNTRTVLRLTKLALPHLIKAKGEVVMVSSIAGLNSALPTMPYYAMAKSALDQLTRSLAIRYIEDGVRVNSVNPGMVRTTIMHKQGMTDEMVEKMESVLLEDKSLVPIRRSGLPRDIAEAIAFLADRSKSEFIIGQNLVIDGGSSLLVPLLSTSAFEKILAPKTK